MVAPTIYRSDDASAPTLSGTGGLVAVLSACLVDGYGSKAAAGWTKPYTGTGKAAFLQGGGNANYLRVDDSGSSYLSRVVGYDAMSDVDTGTGPMPTAAQFSGGLYMRKSITADATARPWLLVGNATAFYLFVFGGSLSLDYRHGDSNFGFGDLFEPRVPSDAKHTFIIGATDTSTTGVTASNNRHVLHTWRTLELSGHYVMTGYGQTGDPLQVGKYPMAPGRWSGTGRSGLTNNTDAVYQRAFPDPLSQSLELAPFVCVETANSYTVRGQYPGLFSIKQDAQQAHLDFRTMTVRRGAYSGREFLIVPSTSDIGAVAIETTGGSW